MPIYEYECRGCGHEFEQLIRTGDTPECPTCHGHDLQRLLSHTSVSTEHTRQVSFKKARARPKIAPREHTSVSTKHTRQVPSNKARARAKLVQRDKDVAQAEYEKKHHEEGH